MKKNNVAEDNQSHRRRDTSFRQRIFFRCRSLLQGTKSKEDQEPTVSKVNNKIDFDEFIDQRSEELREHPDAGKESGIRNDGWKDEQSAESQLADSFIKYSVEIDEYLFFLELALSVPKAHLENPPSSFEGMIVDYFNARREDYDKIKSIRSDDKKYLIFAGAIGVDVAAAEEYNSIVELEVAKYGAPLGNGDACRFFKGKEILYFEDGKDNDEGIINLLTKPDAYSALREAAYASYVSLFPKKKVDIPKKGKEKKLADKVSYLETQLSNMEKASAHFNAVHAIIFHNISDEVNNHLGRFDQDDYGKGVVKLSAQQQIFLTLLFFRQIGISEIRAGDIAYFMASVFGRNSEDYRKIIVKCSNNEAFCGYANKKSYSKAKIEIITILNNIKGTDHDKLKNVIKLIEEQDGYTLAELVSRPIIDSVKKRRK